MNDPGINSFEEFLFFYLAATMLIGAVWVMLEADVLLGATATAAHRRSRQQPILHLFCALGALHPACGILALDAARGEDDVPAEAAAVVERIRRRAKASTLIGIGVFALLCAPHVPVVGELAAIEPLVAAIPWEGR